MKQSRGSWRDNSREQSFVIVGGEIASPLGPGGWGHNRYPKPWGIAHIQPVREFENSEGFWDVAWSEGSTNLCTDSRGEWAAGAAGTSLRTD